jgi:hypothetical protein
MVFKITSQYVLPQVCNERTKGFYTPKCGAVKEKRVGPSKTHAGGGFKHLILTEKRPQLCLPGREYWCLSTKCNSVVWI